MIRKTLTRGTWQILLLWLAGCTPEEPIVARIADREITRIEFKTFVERLPEALRSNKEGRAAAIEHLQSIVDQELLLLEARAQGFDTSAAIQQRLEDLVRQELISHYRSQIIAKRVEVTPADIKRTFVDQGFNRERLFSRILVRTRQELDAVLGQLRSGQPFEQIVQPFAANDLFTRQGDGLVGWISRLDAERRYAVPPKAFTSLAPGQVAAPVRLAGGWQIYRFVEDREAELAEYWTDIEKLVYQEQMRTREEEEFEVLQRHYEARLSPTGASALLRALKTSDAAAAGQVLYNYNGGQISVAEGLASLQMMGAAGALQDSAQIFTLMQKQLLPFRLLEAAARDKGWDRQAEFVDWQRRKNREVVLTALMQGVTRQATPMAEEVKAYYQKNPDEFRAVEEVFVHELWTAEEQQAQALRRELETGAGIADLLDRPEVKSHADVGSHGLRDHDWELRLLRLYRPRFPELVDAAFAAEVGELVGPIKSMDGYTIFKVLRREGGQVQTFEAVRERAEAVLRKGRSDQLIVQFIRQLQQKYSDQVELFIDQIDG